MQCAIHALATKSLQCSLMVLWYVSDATKSPILTSVQPQVEIFTHIQLAYLSLGLTSCSSKIATNPYAMAAKESLACF